MELINDPRALKSRIASLGKAGVKFDETLHVLAYNCLMQVSSNGDTRPLQHLYSLLTPANQRALRVWSCAFGKVRYDSKKNALAYAKNAVHDLPGAEAISPLKYEKAKAEPKTKPAFDFVEQLAKLIDKAKKENTTGKAFELAQKALAA